MNAASQTQQSTTRTKNADLLKYLHLMTVVLEAEQFNVTKIKSQLQLLLHTGEILVSTFFLNEVRKQWKDN